MQDEELSYLEKSEQYNFELEPGNQAIYTFQTANGAIYNVIFKLSPYIFGEESEFAPYVYELIVKLKESESAAVRTDDLIPHTIHDIFIDFYRHFGDVNICLYMCDSSEGKQKVRAGKFMQWFRMLNNGGMIYMTDDIVDLDGIVYPVALLMQRLNPYRFQIIDAFDNLIVAGSKNE